MSPAKRRMSNILIVISILLIAVGISAALYFYKIQKNEDHQNQLHFRELNVAAHSFELSLEQFKGVSKTLSSLGDEERSNFLTRIKTSHSLRHMEVINTPSQTQAVPIKLSKNGYAYHWDKKKKSLRSPHNSKFKTPTAEFLPNNLLFFPLIMIANKNGEILARKEYLRNSTHATDLQFETVTTLLNALEKKQHNINALDDQHPVQGVTYSGAIQLEVGSLNYRVFIQPISTPKQKGEFNTYYLLGFVPQQDIQTGKLSIPADSGLWILMLLLILTACIPVLKILFFPRQHLYSKTDINLFFAGSIILLGIVNIMMNHNVFYSYLLDSKYSHAEKLYTDITTDFNNEVNAIVELVTEKGSAILDSSKNNRKCKGKIAPSSNKIENKTQKVYTDNCPSKKLNFEFKNHTYTTEKSFLETMFRLDHNGVVRRLTEDESKDYYIPKDESEHRDILNKCILTDCARREPIIRISEKTYNYTDFYLAHREYFKHAINCDLWSFESNSECKKGFYIERIKNVSDGRLSSQFAFWDTKKNANSPTVISSAVKLRTFFSRVLPENFGYAVFNDKGDVLYHSDASRVLLENILVETNDNNIQNIMSSSHHSSKAYASNLGSLQPVRFTATYRGTEALFAGGQLSHAVPWKLVVFYKTETLANSTLWVVLLSFSLLFSLLVLLMLWSRFVTKSYFWSKIVSFSSTGFHHYTQFSCAIIGGMTFCLLSMGVIVDLYARLSLWLWVLFSLILWISIKLKIIPSQKNAWAHPVVPFFCLGTIFLILSICKSNSSGYEVNVQNILILLLGLGIFISSFLVSQKRVSNWLASFNPTQMIKKSSKKKESVLIRWLKLDKSITPYRYPASYVVYLSVFLWLFSVVPATLIINSTNHFLLDYKAYNQSQQLSYLIKTKQVAMNDYLSLTSTQQGNNALDNTPKLQVTDFDNLFSSHSKGTCPCRAKIKEPGTNNSSSIWPWISLSNTPIKVDPMLNSLASSEQIGGAISKAFYHFAQSQKHASYTASESDLRLHYDGNLFFQKAFSSKTVSTFIYGLFLFLATLLFVKITIVHRIMGEHLPDNFRALKPKYTKLCFDQISKIKQSGKAVRVQLIRTPMNSAIESISQSLTQSPRLPPCAIDNAILDIETLSSSSNYRKNQFITRLNEVENQGKFIVIKGLERIAFNPNKRKNALALLEEIDKISTLDVFLLCDIAPLFRLCKQSAFAGVSPEYFANADEIAAWTHLLFKYEKLYDWNPPSKTRIQINATIKDVLKHESEGWPALANIKKLHDEQAIQHLINTWKPDQIIEFFASHAGPIYRHKWELCTINERLTLFQLASGSSVNPNNVETLEQLVKRGYIYRECGWFIVNESFRRFVLHAESDITFAQWLEDTNSSSWQYVRVPILIAVLVLVAMVIVGTGQSLQSVLATTTATLGIIPLLLRNLNLFKGAAPLTSE